MKLASLEAGALGSVHGIDGRTRAIGWMFAALTTLEPVIVEREVALLLECNRQRHTAGLPLLEARFPESLARSFEQLVEAGWTGT